MAENGIIYKYVARDSSGLRMEDFKQASCTNEIVSWLHDQDFTPVSITAVSAGRKKKKKNSRRKRIKSAELAAICWQLTTMVEGGIPIIGALETIAEDLDNLQLQNLLQEVSKNMQGGCPFSESLSKFPKVFNKLSCAIILAGESSGNLADALRRLAEYFDTRDKFAKRIKGAMAYPVFVLVFVILIVIFIMAFIIPRFTIMFDQIGGELPAFTKGFMGCYDLICNNLLYIIGFILVVIITSAITFKTPRGHYWFSRTFLSIPLVGKLASQAFVAMFCRMMSTLLSAGVSVLETFDILMGMSNNDIIKSAITQTKENLIAGSNVSSSLGSSGFFPGMVIKMTQVGEESGSMTKVLNRTADYYERRVDAAITTMMALLEPIMIVTVGGIVLIVTLALYLPIFSMKV